MWVPPVPPPLHEHSWRRPAGSTEYRVTSPFGWRTRNGRREWHPGIDVGNARSGGPVVAIGDGRVIAVGFLGPPWSDRSTAYGTGNMGGRMVLVDHGDRQSAYAHLSVAAVKVGQTVRAGQRVGTLGDSGSAKGQAHLHLDLWHNGTRVDPWPLISGGWPEMLLRLKFEPWTMPVGAPFWPEGPGIGRRERVIVAENVWTLTEQADGDRVFRQVVLEDGRVGWTERIRGSAKHIVPKRQGGVPEYDAAVRAVAELGRTL